MKTLPRLLVTAALTAVFIPPALADTWTGATSASWIDGTNWLDGTAPGTGETVVFDANSTANPATTLDGAFSVSGITIAGPSGAVTIANGTGGSLSLGSGGIDMSAATQNLTFSNAIVFGASQTWTVGTGRTLTTSGNLAIGAGQTLLKNGSGTLALGAAGVGSGTLEIAAG